MKKSITARKSTRPTFRPRLESLETRLTPTTFTVSTLADSGEGSFRAAIASVNGGQASEIDFSVAGVIQLTSGALPAITGSVIIDGTTAPGFANAPIVEIDNNGFSGLSLAGVSSSLASLSIVNANGAGVTLEGNGITVVGNYIGLALDGSVAANTGVGLFIDDSIGDTIGGTAAVDRNVISGNGGDGIQLGQSGAVVQDANILGNFIGTDPIGTSAAGNQGNGITVISSKFMSPQSFGNIIGGTDPGEGNIIAFNGQSGVVVPAGQQNAVLSNSIFNNNSTGIGLINTGNPNIPAPQLSFAQESPGSTTGFDQVQIGGILQVGSSSFLCTVQVFATLSGVPVGQGQYFLGSVQVTTNNNGFATFTLKNASVPAGAGTTFTATATSEGGTSVFSGSIGTSTANQVYVANAYQLLLSRIPDPSSFVWVNDLDNGASPASVVLGIEGSTEYLNDQVNAMYQLYLQRPADTAGAQYWVSFLQAGGRLEEVAAGLTSSQEYFVLEGGTDQGFITGLYNEVLKRVPSNAEIAGWETALNNGASRLGVSIAFLTSQEYRTDLVQADYLTFLLRQADQGGLTAFVNALNAGATDQEVLAAIFGSSEGYQLWS